MREHWTKSLTYIFRFCLNGVGCCFIAAAGWPILCTYAHVRCRQNRANINCWRSILNDFCFVWENCVRDISSHS